MMKLLFASSDSKDEGVRTVVGECVGRLAFIDSEQDVFTGIEDRLKVKKDEKPQKNEFIRATMATALKFSVQTQRTLPPFMIETLFKCLTTEKQILPRRSLMLCMNTIINTKPDLIEDQIQILIKQVYPNCETNTDLIRQFELGPI
eukprot:UN28558